MNLTLVTGATGFVGWHVARRLLDRGERVRILVRNAARARELAPAEVLAGDLRDPASVRTAVAGCTAVYHVAADYRLWVRDRAAMFATNVEGTRNVLEACRQAGVERVVYTSTVGCIGIPEGGVGREEMEAREEDMTGPYKRSKFLAERLALDFARQGLPVVIVNPTAPVGDHDFKPTPTGRVIVDYVRGGMPAYLDTGLNLVDIRDVAEGHLLAFARGRPGERYILGCRNMTLREIFAALEAMSGVPAPRWRIPYPVALAFAFASTGWAGVVGGTPRAPLDGVRMARKKMFVSHEKARRELGFEPGPVEDALERAVAWFRANGYC